MGKANKAAVACAYGRGVGEWATMPRWVVVPFLATHSCSRSEPIHLANQTNQTVVQRVGQEIAHRLRFFQIKHQR